MRAAAPVAKPSVPATRGSCRRRSSCCARGSVQRRLRADRRRRTRRSPPARSSEARTAIPDHAVAPARSDPPTSADRGQSRIGQAATGRGQLWPSQSLSLSKSPGSRASRSRWPTRDQLASSRAWNVQSLLNNSTPCERAIAGRSCCDRVSDGRFQRLMIAPSFAITRASVGPQTRR